jgi:low temperature requirement protein LtrA
MELMNQPLLSPEPSRLSITINDVAAGPEGGGDERLRRSSLGQLFSWKTDAAMTLWMRPCARQHWVLKQKPAPDGGGMVDTWKSSLADDDEERGATSNDLVLDLAYAFMLSRVGKVFTHNLHDSGRASLAWRNGLAVFIPIWLQLLHTNRYLNSFDQPDAVFFTMFMIHLGIAVAMANSSEACGDILGTANTPGACEAFCYTLSGGRAFLALCHSYALYYNRGLRHVIVRGSIAPALLSALLWLGAAFSNSLFDPDADAVGSFLEFACWTVPIVFDIGQYWWSAGHSFNQSRSHLIPLNVPLCIERIELFVVLSLGEVVAASVGASASADSRAFLIVAVVVGMKFVYFDLNRVAPRATGTEGAERHDYHHAFTVSRVNGLIWGFLHCPLNVCIVVIGACLEPFTADGVMEISQAHGFAGCMGCTCFIVVLLNMQHKYTGPRPAHLRQLACVQICISILMWAAGWFGWDVEEEAGEGEDEMPLSVLKSPVALIILELALLGMFAALDVAFRTAAKRGAGGVTRRGSS